VILQLPLVGILRSTFSVMGHRIRLTAERWIHVVEHHEELAGMLEDVLVTIASPETVYAGKAGESIAVTEYDTGLWLAAVYIDQQEGFVVTAFLTSRRSYFERRLQLWP
jgi:hypothetical protein